MLFGRYRASHLGLAFEAGSILDVIDPWTRRPGASSGSFRSRRESDLRPAHRLLQAEAGSYGIGSRTTEQLFSH